MVKLKFTTISPLHISNGNELSYNIEYIEKDELFCKLDIQKASKRYSDNKLFDFSKSYSFRDFIRIVDDKKHLLEKSDFIYRLESSSDFLYHLRNARADGLKIVKEFINNNGKFYIPASSIKGTLATILGKDSIGIDDSIRQKFVILDSSQILEESFSILRTYKGRPSLNLICIKPFIDFEIEIRKLGDISLNQLKESIVTYYKKQFDTAIKCVSEYIPQGKSDKESGAEIFLGQLYEYKRVMDEELNKDEYLINLGFGSGTYFKLFDFITEIPTYFNSKTKRKEKPHTAFTFFDSEFIDPIGWCKLKIEE